MNLNQDRDFFRNVVSHNTSHFLFRNREWALLNEAMPPKVPIVPGHVTSKTDRKKALTNFWMEIEIFQITTAFYSIVSDYWLVIQTNRIIQCDWGRILIEFIFHTSTKFLNSILKLFKIHLKGRCEWKKFWKKLSIGYFENLYFKESSR